MDIRSLRFIIEANENIWYFSMQDSLVPLPPQQIGVLPSAACRGGPLSSAPPAHQSPKPSRSSSTSSGSGAPPPAGSVGPTLVRQVNAEPLMYVSPNKRTKYSVQPPAMSPQSILRNQLQIAKEMSQQQQAQQAQQLMQQQQTQPQQLNISQVIFCNYHMSADNVLSKMISKI